jgi:hypothetical protein
VRCRTRGSARRAWKPVFYVQGSSMFSSSRHRSLLFGLLTITAVALVGTLGWQLLRRYDLDRQRTAARRGEAADLIVSALRDVVQTTEEALRDRNAVRAAAATPDSASVILQDGELEVLPYGRLLYHPVASPGFASADADAVIRGAEDLRQRGADAAALASYAKAMRMAWTAIGDVPTELFARAARCEVLAAAGRSRELRVEALDLRELLLDGRWRITRSTFESYLDAATKWSRAGERPAMDRLDGGWDAVHGPCAECRDANDRPDCGTDVPRARVEVAGHRAWRSPRCADRACG